MRNCKGGSKKSFVTKKSLVTKKLRSYLQLKFQFTKTSIREA